MPAARRSRTWSGHIRRRSPRTSRSPAWSRSTTSGPTSSWTANARCDQRPSSRRLTCCARAVSLLLLSHAVTSYPAFLDFVLGMTEDAGFEVGVVKFGAIGTGAFADSEKYFGGGQHAQRRSHEIDP